MYTPLFAQENNRRANWDRRVFRLFIASGVIAAFAIVLSVVEDRLLHSGVLNAHDLAPFIGDVRGMWNTHLLNVWYWDGMIAITMFAAGILIVVGIAMRLYASWLVSGCE